MKKILFLALIALGLTACFGQNNGSGVFEDRAYDRTIETDTLRVGYITYPPSFITDPNSGEFSGISHDILIRAAENLGLEVDFVEEVAWGSMIEAINAERVDVIATGIWPTAARGKRADFVTPIFYSPVVAYVRADDVRFDGNLEVADKKDMKIAVLDGEMAQIIASSDFPKAQQVSLTQINQVSQLLLDVSSGKADITFVEPATARAYMDKNPGTIKAVEGVAPVRAFPTAFLVSKDAPKLKSMLSIAVEELIRNGDVNRIIDIYEEHEGSFVRVPTIK